MFSRSLKAGASGAVLAAIVLGVSASGVSALSTSPASPFAGTAPATRGSVYTGSVSCYVDSNGAFIRIETPAILATSSSFTGMKEQPISYVAVVQGWTGSTWKWIWQSDTQYTFAQIDHTSPFAQRDSVNLVRGTAQAPLYYRVVFEARWYSGYRLLVGSPSTYNFNASIGWGDYTAPQNDYHFGLGVAKSPGDYCQF